MFIRPKLLQNLNDCREGRPDLRRLSPHHLSSKVRRMLGAVADRGRGLRKGENGLALVEVLIAVSILTIAITTYISAFSTSAIAIGREDRRVTAKVLAVSQIHHTRAQAYQTAPVAYPTLTPPSPNFTVTSNATAIAGKDDNIQQVTVTVQFNGRTLSVLEDFKVDR